MHKQWVIMGGRLGWVTKWPSRSIKGQQLTTHWYFGHIYQGNWPQCRICYTVPLSPNKLGQPAVCPTAKRSFVHSHKALTNSKVIGHLRYGPIRGHGFEEYGQMAQWHKEALCLSKNTELIYFLMTIIKLYLTWELTIFVAWVSTLANKI